MAREELTNTENIAIVAMVMVVLVAIVLVVVYWEDIFGPEPRRTPCEIEVHAWAATNNSIACGMVCPSGCVSR